MKFKFYMKRGGNVVTYLNFKIHEKGAPNLKICMHGCQVSKSENLHIWVPSVQIWKSACMGAKCPNLKIFMYGCQVSILLDKVSWWGGFNQSFIPSNGSYFMHPWFEDLLDVALVHPLVQLYAPLVGLDSSSKEKLQLNLDLSTFDSYNSIDPRLQDLILSKTQT